VGNILPPSSGSKIKPSSKQARVNLVVSWTLNMESIRLKTSTRLHGVISQNIILFLQT
jgi:hypothetical protein